MTSGSDIIYSLDASDTGDLEYIKYKDDKGNMFIRDISREEALKISSCLSAILTKGNGTLYVRPVALAVNSPDGLIVLCFYKVVALNSSKEPLPECMADKPFLPGPLDFLYGAATYLLKEGNKDFIFEFNLGKSKIDLYDTKYITISLLNKNRYEKFRYKIDWSDEGSGYPVKFCKMKAYIFLDEWMKKIKQRR